MRVYLGAVVGSLLAVSVARAQIAEGMDAGQPGENVPVPAGPPGENGPGQEAAMPTAPAEVADAGATDVMAPPTEPMLPGAPSEAPDAGAVGTDPYGNPIRAGPGTPQ